jgi:hypothetical protein
MNPNEIHHIIQEFKSFKDDKKERLIRLIQVMLRVHPNLFSDNLNSKIFFVNYPISGEDNGEIPDVSLLTNIFTDFNVFMELLRLMTKTSYIKKMSKTMKEFVGNEDKLEKMRESFNTVILINLIRKRLENKNHSHIQNYLLFNKLTDISSDLDLGLGFLSTVKDNDISKYMNDRYHYTNMFDLLNVNSVKDHYFDIYHLFLHFL